VSLPQSAGRYRRKKVLVHKGLQLRCALYLGVILFLAFCVVGINFYFGIWDGVVHALTEENFCEDFLLTKRSEEPWLYMGEDGKPLISTQSEKLSRNQRAMVGRILQTVHVRLLPSAMVLIFLAGWLSVFLTHRIAGPIYRIMRDLRTVDAGDLRTRVDLRNKDEGKVLAEAINATLSNFDMTVTALKRIVRKHESAPEKMKELLRAELSRLKTTGE
jgi:nitrogen fixation/metabolism regulation signal transduction histidine kinase